MNIPFKNLYEIKGGLSKKKVFRKIEYRLNKIIIDFSEDKKEFHNFLNIYKILKKINISIPKIYEVNVNKNFIVMEDFGIDSFDRIFNEKQIYNLLKLAVDNLIIIQNSICCDDLVNLEKYTYSELVKEISEFINYYIPYKNIDSFNTNYFYALWEKNFKNQNFCFDSFVFKDFEFINLIFLKRKNSHLQCGIIDFQNAFLGFKGWDLFTILENPRINFTRTYNEDLIKYFYENTNLPQDFNVFRDQYYILNLARHTRLLGRWVKLYNEGNKNCLDFLYSTQKRLISCLDNIKDKNLIKLYQNVLLD
tara:strand:- start:289 stop:1209 length:921 start_codon:yes stop_codon:yes gene_type:complete